MTYTVLHPYSNTYKDFRYNMRFFNRKIFLCLCWGQIFKSEGCPIISGIPQGSVLGPLLFVIYINDLPNSVKSFTELFADDLKMIAKASNKLQVDNDLKMLELWESTWLLEFNVKKCKVLHTSFNNNPYNTYHLNRKVMLMSDQEKYLGVLTTCNLLWNDQNSDQLLH